jgi:hypothetical protein
MNENSKMLEVSTDSLVLVPGGGTSKYHNLVPGTYYCTVVQVPASLSESVVCTVSESIHGRIERLANENMVPVVYPSTQ